MTGNFTDEEIVYIRESINLHNELGVAWEGMRRFFEKGELDKDIKDMVDFLNLNLQEQND